MAVRMNLGFDRQCVMSGLYQPEREYRFAPPRRWRFDWAWPVAGGGGIAVEVQGGLFTRGRHSRGAALLNEHEKLNAAAALGWRVCFTTPKDVENGAAVMMIQRVFRGEVPAKKGRAA